MIIPSLHPLSHSLVFSPPRLSPTQLCAVCLRKTCGKITGQQTEPQANMIIPSFLLLYHSSSSSSSCSSNPVMCSLPLGKCIFKNMRENH
mmetsp:Transcript_12875/g.21700  ORF Transcript_12875/g.21700 Transcript_12875/m.21700 type:complete len:90 (-) Transcript_12875:298-567(-)